MSPAPISRDHPSSEPEVLGLKALRQGQLAHYFATSAQVMCRALLRVRSHQAANICA